MIVAFAGLRGSGKDTAADVLVQEYGFTRIAFADPVRELALAIDPFIPIKYNYGREDREVNVYLITERLSVLVARHGWDKLKRDIPEVRRLLQAIGTDAIRSILGENVWIGVLNDKFIDVMASSTRYVISDCRFANEAHFIQNGDGIIFWISRPGIVSDGHSSENTHIKSYAVAEISNDSTIEEFQQQVREYVEAEGFYRE